MSHEEALDPHERPIIMNDQQLFRRKVRKDEIPKSQN